MIFEYFRNRKSVGWFVGAALLALVIVAFVALYFPDFMGDPATAAMRRGVAWVNGDAIPASTFLDRYRDVSARYQQQSGGEFNSALARQLGIPEQVVGELVRDRVLVLEAERHGLVVTDAEVSSTIRNAPAFQENGVFIGAALYLDRLAAARMNPRDFEASLRSDLLAGKLQALVTQSPNVSDAELLTEYRRRNESASLDLWFISNDGQRGDVEVSEDEARAHYDADPTAFEVGLGRQVRFVTISEQVLAEEVSIRQREIQRYYNRNLFQYQTGEQAEASHILLTPESEADEAATRTLAARLAERAREGEDFAELARTYSNDEATAQAGGALGVFGPEEMLPEFAEAVFEMTPGEISEPIRTDYGFHVVQLESLQPGDTQEIAEVEADIESRLRRERATELMTERMIELEERAVGARSLDAVTAGYPLMIPQESDFFTADEPVAELGSLEAARLAFEIEVGEVGGPVSLPTGFAFIEVIGERAPHTPPFEDITEQVLEELRSEQARVLAEENAETLLAQVESGQTADTDPVPLESWFRGSPLGGAGLLPMAEEAIFVAEAGSLIGPLEAARGYAVIRVNGTNGFVSEDFEAQKESFRAQMAEERRQRIWSSYVGAAVGRYDIQIDREALNALIG